MIDQKVITRLFDYFRWYVNQFVDYQTATSLENWSFISL